MSRALYLILLFFKHIYSQTTREEVQYLNELSIEKLLQLKNTLKDFTPEYENVTLTSPTYLNTFGAQAMAIKAPPIKRGDYEEGPVKKVEYSKVSNIFSMSVTALAFLAFGGYLLCLIVQAVKSKQATMSVPTTQSTLFFNAGIKKPQTQFASYGRRKREGRSMNELDLPPEELFSSLLQLCEGYVKWSEHDNGHK